MITDIYLKKYLLNEQKFITQEKQFNTGGNGIIKCILCYMKKWYATLCFELKKTIRRLGSMVTQAKTLPVVISSPNK